MSMSYTQLLMATLAEIEKIRRQPESYCRQALSQQQLETLRCHLATLYSNRPQSAFAQHIYMKAA